MSQYLQGFDYTERVHTMKKIEHYIHNVMNSEVQLVKRCLLFIQVSRVSREHKYQPWQTPVPKPVIPDYVRKAVERHREQFGAQSIY